MKHSFQLQVVLQSNVPQPDELYEEDDDVDAALSELQVGPLEFLFPKFSFGTMGFRLGNGIRCLEPEAQNAVLSLEVAKIHFSN